MRTMETPVRNSRNRSPFPIRRQRKYGLSPKNYASETCLTQTSPNRHNQADRCCTIAWPIDNGTCGSLIKGWRSTVPAITRKRLALSRGLKRHTRARLFPLAKIDGSRSAKAIESLMRNGKMPDHSEQTTGNTCLATNGQNPISTKAPDSMSRQRCVTISD
jgi:hypothetical protein